MWPAIIASFSLGIVHDTDLVRALHANPALADEVRYLPLPGKADAFHALHETLPDFGAEVAVDAADVKAWANRLHEHADPDSKLGANPKAGVRTYWRAYKVHLAVDANAELRISSTLTRASTSPLRNCLGSSRSA